VRPLRIVAILLVALLAYPVILGIQIWQQSRDDELDELQSGDAIVVLGAAQYDGDPSPVYQARLDHAANIYERGFSDVIIVTGGKQEGDRFTEAEAGESYLINSRGVSSDRILLETSGRTTLESLEGVRVISDDFGYESIILVSDPMHSKRIKTMAFDLGFDNAWVSFANYLQFKRSRATKAKELLHEIASMIAYQLLNR
jgi:vancomycin permeability regulator SanA